MKRIQVLVALLAVTAAAPARPDPLTSDCLVAASATAEIGAAAEGVLSAIRVERGDRVAAGDVLVALEAGAEESRAALARIRAGDDTAIRIAEARAEEARTRLERARSLVARGLAEAERAESAALDLATAELEREAALRARQIARGERAAAEADLARRIVRAPFDGVVVARTMELGEHYDRSESILTLARTDPLHVEAFLPLARAAALAPGQDVVVELEAGGRHPAVIDVIDPVADAATGTLGIRATLPNPDAALVAGQTCRLFD